MDQNDFDKHTQFGFSMAAATELVRDNATRPNHFLGRFRNFALEFAGAFLVSVVYDHLKRLYANNRRKHDPMSEKGSRPFNATDVLLPSVGPRYGDADVADIHRLPQQQAQVQGHAGRVPEPKSTHAEDASDRKTGPRARSE
jgi:hypothetical protein